MGLSLSHILLVLVVALFVFGAGRLPVVMADLARGLKAFRKGLRDEDDKSSLSHKSKPKGKL
jgi:sec-independent protein translocase protein TatA